MSTTIERPGTPATEPYGQPRGSRRPRRLRGRPELYTSYGADMALLNTTGKRRGVLAIVVAALAIPFLFADDLLLLMATGFALAIGAIGLNLLTGYAGQVSLGHAFFVGVGAYTAAALSGDAGGRTIGYEAQMIVWLPASAITAGLLGLVVAPIATRLRGLYLAIVTLGLVFLAEHVYREWGSLTGGLGVGRPGPVAEVFGFSFNAASAVGGYEVTRRQKEYLLCFAVLAVASLLARNLARSDVGRAFAAVRDRDIAAEVIGVGLTKAKLQAFTISSAYAGVCGGLLYSVTGVLEPTSLNLLVSVEFIAMILIGGVATVSGSIMGAMFLALLPRLTQEIPRFLPFVTSSPTGGLINTAQLESLLYGLLLILFLIFEPRGLFGVWVRVRNYWKGWPFSY